MKQFVQSMAKKNRQVERVLQLGMKTARAIRSHGLRQTGSLIAKRIHQKSLALLQQRHHRRHRAKLGLPTGWPDVQIPSQMELAHQRNWSKAEGYRPTISLILPLSAHSLQALKETVKSVTDQSYQHWTLHIIYLPNDEEATNALQALERLDSRIHLLSTGSNQTPWESLNLALDTPKSEYCGVILEGDRLAVDALYHVAHTLTQAPETDVVYTDEVHVKPHANQIQGVLLKPDWSPELLMGYNYIGGLSVIRRTLLNQVGGYLSNYQEAQEWDLLLRLSETDCHFKRVPRCCYLRRTDSGFVPTGTAQKGTEAPFRKALEDHIRRRKLPATVETCENGVLRIRWSLPKHPLVSIIIPNKNNVELVRSLVDDLLFKTDYPNKEIIVVDNLSTDPAVHEFYRKQTETGRIRVVPFNQEFNYSAACNTGAGAARGDFLLFLNNDMEVISPDWLEELVGWASLPRTGVVGTKLFYPDGSLQHCGVVIGLHYVTHINHRADKTEWGVFGTPDSYRNYIGVTGACQMISRTVFDAVGGYDENYQIAYSDIALCLRAWKKGYRIVYTPHAALIHYEQYTRGDNTPLPDMEMMAKELRELNFREDPHFHPELNATRFTPTLRLPGEGTPREMLQRYIRKHNPTPEYFLPVNWFDDEEIQQLAAGCGVAFSLPTYSPREVADDHVEAANFILYVLRNHEDIRTRFPKALSEGAQGAFCRWLCDEGLRRFRISQTAGATIREVFEENPGIRVRQIYAFRPNLRHDYPTALLPTGQRGFFHWLLVTRFVQHTFRDEEIWWLCLEAAEDPLKEFEFTYRISKEWQQNFPAGLTAFGSRKLLSWLKSRHQFDQSLLESIQARTNRESLEDVRYAYWNKPEWRSRFPRAFRDEGQTQDLLSWLRAQSSTIPGPDLKSPSPSSLGLNVLGHFCYPSGLQQSVQSIVGSLELENVAVSLRDVPAHIDWDNPNREEFLGLETHDVSVIHVQPVPYVEQPYFETVYNSAGLVPRPGVYRIGLWYWELDEVPFTWNQAAQTVQELWAPTEFIANAMRSSLPTKVTPILPGVKLGTVEPVSRKELGVAEDEYLFLFMFDMKSMMERKNPLGLIEAYKTAFRHEKKAKLMIKLSSGSFNQEEFARLKSAAKEAGAILMDKVLSREKSYGLIDACDCYVSLHRSEGLGLTMAEAMLMAKPVIATAYSGNVDFMDSSSAMLVDYEIRQLRGTCPDYVYRIYKDHTQWANPSVEHAASWMRWAFEHQEEAKALGIQAKQHAEDILSPKAAGRRLKARLEEIYQALHSDDSTSTSRSAA